ncbi:hypothetical protein [Streptomyces sp. A13(2022)]|uniref:phage terminase small subunit n=1 Tax=Streptomyces sp. A13(2022) TaxID=2964768 RepID=UPI0021D7EC32|nr:hypothetical protein [Streptomyces sp. A13(2022)]MCU8589934.1 hypothetical protein [Streptomyces sp. A13(2022)]
MAGVGGVPKDPSKRARRNKDTIPQTVLRWERAEAPELPDFRIEKGEELVEFHWPERTREWWRMWIESPQAEHFGSSDWEYLLDTALIHARFWSGNLSLAGELRLRVAEFGATPSARARLRMVFADADGADQGQGRSGAPSAREMYGNLRMMPGGKTDQGKGA